MSFPAVPTSLRSLAEHLPFPLADTEAAGRAFAQWREADGPAAERQERIVDLWTYCFVHRYFLSKFAMKSTYPPSDFDELVTRVYGKVVDKRADVREPHRYAHWVSVVCKNTFLNYVNRRRPPDLSLDADDAPQMASAERVRGEVGLAREIVNEAVARLPAYLQPVAQMRLLEERPYEEISEAIDLDVPTVRTYAARAREHLRKDDGVRALLL